MSHLASARKYRPQRWAEVLGQQSTVRILQSAIRQERIAGAYLFCGQHGCGKTTIGRLLAKALNCDCRKLPDTEPCCECLSCKSVATGHDIEVLEIDAASNRGIDDAREIVKIATQQVRLNKWRIIILDEAHQLTKECQNALLALFESPPPRFLPILCTTDADKLLPTIASRCQTFRIRPIPFVEIEANLRMIFADHSQTISESALFSVARVSNGSLRDVQQIADQLILSAEGAPIDDDFVEQQAGIPTVAMFRQIAGALTLALSEGVQVWFDAVQSLWEDGVDLSTVFASVLPTLIRDFRVAIVSRGFPAPVVPYESGIPHAVFEQRCWFTFAHLDIMWQAWEDIAKNLGHGYWSDKAVLEFWIFKVSDQIAWDLAHKT